MPGPQLIYADFNNLEDPKRLKLTCAGTFSDLKKYGIDLRDGLPLTFYMDDADDEGRSDKLLVDGTVQYNQADGSWVGVVDWDTMRHESDEQSNAAGGTAVRGQQVATATDDAASLLRQAASVAGGTAALGAMRRGGIATATASDVATEVGDPGEVDAPVRLPPDARPTLVVQRGLKLNVEYPIYEGITFIGRSDEKPVDIDLDDQEPPDRVWSSRQHCLISFENGELNLEDLNSANGTFVNRTRVYPGTKHRLSPNDVIQVGTVQLKLKT